MAHTPDKCPPPLILASSSPRRQELLAKFGLAFTVIATDAETEADGTSDPCARAESAALTKARAVSSARPEALVLAADTLVWLDGEPMGKPADEQQAREMLRKLSGRAHVVHTGVALVGPVGSEPAETVACVDTVVHFRQLSDDLIARYVATGEAMDKAGAYGIQGRGAVLVESIQGCYYNVVGLPLSKVAEMLEAHGLRLL